MQRADAARAPVPRPRCSARTRRAGALAMQFLPPERYPLWKTQLRDGDADPAFAAQVADTLVAHPCRHRRRSRRRGGVPHRPRSSTTSGWSPTWSRPRRAHPDLRAGAAGAGRDHAGEQARAGARRRQPEEHPARARRPGVPRRRMRLVGRSGVRPRLLPQSPAAEMPLDAVGRRPASWPASMRLPPPISPRVAWEPPAALEARAAHLLPGLLLARVDGKSPVEYITDGAGQEPGAARRAGAAGRPGRDRSATCARPGRRSWPHDRHHDRLRARPPRLGQPRPPDGGGRSAAGRRRASAAPSHRPAPRPAPARRSTCATAATAFGGYDVTRAVGHVNGEIAARRAPAWTPPTRPRSTRG